MNYELYINGQTNCQPFKLFLMHVYFLTFEFVFVHGTNFTYVCAFFNYSSCNLCFKFS